MVAYQYLEPKSSTAFCFDEYSLLGINEHLTCSPCFFRNRRPSKQSFPMVFMEVLSSYSKYEKCMSRKQLSNYCSSHTVNLVNCFETVSKLTETVFFRYFRLKKPNELNDLHLFIYLETSLSYSGNLNDYSKSTAFFNNNQTYASTMKFNFHPVTGGCSFHIHFPFSVH